MFRDIFSGSRLILAGLVFFVLVVGGSLLYSRHARRTNEIEVARTEQPAQPPENRKEIHTQQDTVDTSTLDFEHAQTPREVSANTQIPDDSEVLPDASLDIVGERPPDSIDPVEEPSEEMPVASKGFGPYPEIPADYPEHLMPSWVRNPNTQSVSGRAAGPFELMDRVLIKLWKQGHTNLTGASLSNSNGKVYPHYANTAYVRYKEFTTSDGVVHRTISRIKGGPDIAPYFKQIRLGKTPAHIKLLDYDSGGIDPHTFLKEGN